MSLTRVVRGGIVINAATTLGLWAGLCLLAVGCGDDQSGSAQSPDTGADTTPMDTGPDDVAADSGQADVAPDVVDAADTADVVDTVDTAGPPPCPWEPYNEGLKGGRVNNVQFDTRGDGAVYAMAGSLIFRSRDDGATWEPWSDGEIGASVLGFPTDDTKKFFSASAAGFAESRDFGQSFDAKSLVGLGLSEMIVHPAATQRIYVGTNGGGVFRSDNQGESWAPKNLGVPLSHTWRMVGDPRDPDVVLMGVVLLNDGLGFSGNGEILRTDNGGNSWTTTLDNIGWARDLDLCATDPDRVYAAIRNSVATSDDGGLTWDVSPALANKDVLMVAASATDCDEVYAAVYREGVYRSLDGGQTFTPPSNTGFEIEPARFNPTALEADPADSTRLLIATHGGLYRTTDAGQTWSLLDVSEGVAPGPMRSSPADPERLWIATWGNGVWTKPDFETPWQRVPVAALPRDFTIAPAPHPTDPDTVYISAAPELFRSTDQGADFTALPLAKNTIEIGVLEDPDVLLSVSQVAGVQRSDDDGDTWIDSNGGLTPWATSAGEFIDVRTIWTDPDDDSVALIGTRGQGIWRSTDRALNWTQVAPSISNDSVLRIVADPGPPRVFYAFVQDLGIYRSSDDGATWETLNSGLDSLDITDVVLDAESGRLFITTANSSVFRSDDGLTWAPFDRFCLPDQGFRSLAIVSDDKDRWLVIVGGNNEVLRHKL